MNIQIYVYKKDFDVQKAERWFKERRIPFQEVDLKKHKLGLRELEKFRQQVGLKALIDTQGKAYLESPVRMMTGETAILEALLRDPKLIKMPIVRDGNRATVGFQPEIWESWT